MENMINNESGFSVFSVYHIVVIVLIVFFTIVCAVFYRKLSGPIQKKAGLIFGTCIVGLDISHYVVYYFLGILSVYAIPLHLCYLAVYVCFLFGIFKADWMGQVLYALCLPGAWCAIVFPDWTRFPIFSYPSLDSFITHGLVVIFIVMHLAAGNINPRLSAIWKPILFLCVTAPIAALANHFLGTNFMFISNVSAGSPLEFLSVLSNGSQALYLLLYAILVLIGMTVMYLPFLIYNSHKKLRKENK